MVNVLELPSHGRRDGGLNVDEHRKRLLELGKRAAGPEAPEEFMRRSNEKLL
jgi:hypothetical protein